MYVHVYVCHIQAVSHDAYVFHSMIVNNYTPPPPQFQADPTLKLKTFNAHILELQQLVTPQNAAVPYLDHINSCLHNAILSCRAAVEAEKTPNATFPAPEKIPATKKPEYQWLFKKTTKTPGRKRNTVDSGC